MADVGKMDRNLALEAVRVTEAAALAASFAVNDGGGVRINVPGAEEEKPRWKTAFEAATAISPNQEPPVDPLPRRAARR